MSSSPAHSSWAFPQVESESSPRAETPPGRRRRVVTWLVGLAIVGVALQTVGVLWRERGTTEVVLSAEAESTATSDAVLLDAPLPEDSPATPVTTLVVHVVGAVVTPGVVELPAGSRIADALQQVGGARDDADLGQVNLARVVQDGEQIRVPALGEDSGASGDGATTPALPGTISLSRADHASLESLPGVGPVLAQRIIEWRSAHGDFRHVEDVLAIPGIGPSTLDLFRNRVSP